MSLCLCAYGVDAEEGSQVILQGLPEALAQLGASSPATVAKRWRIAPGTPAEGRGPRPSPFESLGAAARPGPGGSASPAIRLTRTTLALSLHSGSLRSTCGSPRSLARGGAWRVTPRCARSRPLPTPWTDPRGFSHGRYAVMEPANPAPASSRGPRRRDLTVRTLRLGARLGPARTSKWCCARRRDPAVTLIHHPRRAPGRHARGLAIRYAPAGQLRPRVRLHRDPAASSTRSRTCAAAAR